MPNHFTLFISDLHLQPEQPQITQAFLQLLQTQAPKADALYILGDLFEYWLGDDNLNAFNRQIADALHKLTQQNVPIYFIKGNRDFLLGKRFAKQCSMQILSDYTVISLYERRTLLMHGDCLCTLDKTHQFFYRLTRCRLTHILCSWIPLRYRLKIAQRARQHSELHKKQLSAAIMDATPEAINQAFHDHQCDLLIHGHTHRPKVHTVPLGTQTATRIVLGAWHQGASILKYQQSGQFELIHIPYHNQDAR